MQHTSTASWDLYRITRLVLLAAGPFLTLAAVHSGFAGWPATEFAGIEFAAVMLWSPLFFSVPALWLQQERDRALANVRNPLVRGLRLIPYLLSSASQIRAEMAISVLSWVAMTVMSWNSVTSVLARLQF